MEVWVVRLYDYQGYKTVSEEIRKSQEQLDLETLQRTQPQWKLARNEPFIQNPQNDVTPPDWDGVDIRNRDRRGDGDGGGNQGSLLAVMGVQQSDGTFAIKIVSFAGTATDP